MTNNIHKTLNISVPSIRKNGAEYSRIEYLLNQDGDDSFCLWYELPQEYEEYLSIEVADGVIVGLLLYAMKNRCDIVSSIPISTNLYFNLTKYLMPFLCKINPELHQIKLEMPLSETVYQGKHVGTGISCGIDSLSTVIYHGEEENVPNHKIDTLSLFNTGYYGAAENNSLNYRKYLAQSIDFCKEHNYKFFTFDSNISNITHYDFLTAHTYLTCSVVLLMQKYYGLYYYSSGYPVMSFKATFKDPAYYDVFLLDCISTQSLKFISSCSTMTRVEKTDLVLRHPEIQKSLYVCLGGNPPVNCCQCEKCVRTMLTIDSLGKLDEIKFECDKAAYQRNRGKYIAYMLRHRKSNVYYSEIYESFKVHHISIPLICWIYPIPTKFETISFLRKMQEKMNKNRLGSWLVRKTRNFIKSKVL